MTQALTIRALMMAINLCQPKAGLIHHSDRGSQYASEAYQTLLKQHGIRPSMSRKGNCWDNAVMERFFKSYKEEWIGDQVYHTGMPRFGIYTNTLNTTTAFGCFRRSGIEPRWNMRMVLAGCLDWVDHYRLILRKISDYCLQ